MSKSPPTLAATLGFDRPSETRGRHCGQGSCGARLVEVDILAKVHASLAPQSLLLPHCPKCAAQGYLTFPEVVQNQEEHHTTVPPCATSSTTRRFCRKVFPDILSWGALGYP